LVSNRKIESPLALLTTNVDELYSSTHNFQPLTSTVEIGP